MDQREDQTVTDQECIELLRGNSELNKARQQFSNWSAKIEQAQAQRTSLSPIEMRKMEFEAVVAIGAALCNVFPIQIRALLHRSTAPGA